MSANEHNPEARFDELTERQRRVQDEVRAAATPVARESFRSRLREQFVSGEFPQGARELEAGRPSAAGRVLGSRRAWRWSVPLAAAAALVLMFSTVNRGTTWELASVGEATTSISLDGRTFSCDDLDPIQAALHPGCRVVVPAGGSVEIQDEGQLLLQLNGAVEVTLPTPRSRWWGGPLESEFRGEGTLRVATGEDFEAGSYRIHAGSLDLSVTGTTFTVIQSGDETCICVLDGEVVATLNDGSVRSIAAGRRLTIDRETGALDEGEMRADERDQLEGLRSRAVLG